MYYDDTNSNITTRLWKIDKRKSFFYNVDNSIEHTIYSLENKILNDSDRNHIKYYLKHHDFFPLLASCLFANVTNYEPFIKFELTGEQAKPIIECSEKFRYEKSYISQCDPSIVKLFLTDENLRDVIKQLLKNPLLCYGTFAKIFDAFIETDVFANNKSFFHNFRDFLLTMLEKKQPQQSVTLLYLHKSFAQFQCYWVFIDDELAIEKLMNIHDVLNDNWFGNEGFVEKVFVDDYITRNIVKYFL